MPGSQSRLMGTSGAATNSTADRAVDVLLLFDEQHPLRSANEVSKLLHMPRSTTYRYLQTLRAKGLVEDDGGRGFRLGGRILQLARIARIGLGLPEIALPVMREIAAKVQEDVILTRRSGSNVVCVERVQSPQTIRLSYERGHVLPVHAGASAKVLLAFSDPAEIDAALATARLPRFTPRTVTDPKVLRKQLEEIRAQGYAVGEGEVDEGVRAVAAPIFGRDGRVVAGVSVAGPAFRLTPKRMPIIIRAVRDGAEAISARFADLQG